MTISVKGISVSECLAIARRPSSDNPSSSITRRSSQILWKAVSAVLDETVCIMVSLSAVSAQAEHAILKRACANMSVSTENGWPWNRATRIPYLAARNQTIKSTAASKARFTNTGCSQRCEYSCQYNALKNQKYPYTFRRQVKRDSRTNPRSPAVPAPELACISAGQACCTCRADVVCIV